MNHYDLARIIRDQHEIRAQRFHTGPHSDTTMTFRVRDMMHLRDYLDDQGL